MKKAIFLVLIMVLSLTASVASAINSDVKSVSPAVPDKTENKLSADEIGRMTKRVEEIRDMDKKEMTGKEKHALNKELKGIKENVKHDGGYIYIGGTTLLLIILILILL